MTDSAPASTTFHQAPLGKVARGVSGSVSVAGLAGGTAATFTTDNGLGTAGLLLIGGVSGLIALLGRVPRIRVGENEIDPSAAYVVGYTQGHDVAAEAATEAALEAKSPAEVAQAARVSYRRGPRSPFGTPALEACKVLDALALSRSMPVITVPHSNGNDVRIVAHMTNQLPSKQDLLDLEQIAADFGVSLVYDERTGAIRDASTA